MSSSVRRLGIQRVNTLATMLIFLFGWGVSPVGYTLDTTVKMPGHSYTISVYFNPFPCFVYLTLSTQRPVPLMPCLYGMGG